MRSLMLLLLALTGACDRPRYGSPIDQPAGALFAYAAMQETFRAEDLDRNGEKDYWRQDVAGLYLRQPGPDVGPKLKAWKIARADPQVQGEPSLGEAAPYSGQWLKALRFTDERPEALDPTRFAVCAYADSHGKVVCIMSQKGILYWKPWASAADTPDVYPDPDTLKREWRTWEYQPKRHPTAR